MESKNPIYLGNIPLDARCEHCDNAGMVYNPEYQTWVEGGEQGPEPPDYYTCEECEGRRYIPTDAGRAILELLRRHS